MPTFQVQRALAKAEETLYPIWQEHLIVFYTKAEQEERGWVSEHFPEAALLTDCTVQQCNHPLGQHGNHSIIIYYYFFCSKPTHPFW
jgi:hypothetical protein